MNFSNSQHTIVPTHNPNTTSDIDKGKREEEEELKLVKVDDQTEEEVQVNVDSLIGRTIFNMSDAEYYSTLVYF